MEHTQSIKAIVNMRANLNMECILGMETNHKSFPKTHMICLYIFTQVRYRKLSAKLIKLRMLMLMKRKKAFLEMKRKEEEAFHQRHLHLDRVHEELCRRMDDLDQEVAEWRVKADEEFKARRQQFAQWEKDLIVVCNQQFQLYEDKLAKADKEVEEARRKAEEVEKREKIVQLKEQYNKRHEKELAAWFDELRDEQIELHGRLNLIESREKGEGRE